MRNNLTALFPGINDGKVIEQFLHDGTTTISGGGNFSSKSFFISHLLQADQDIENLLWIVSNHQEKESAMRAITLWSHFTVYCLGLEPNDLHNNDIERKNKINILSFLSKVKSSKGQAFIIEYKDVSRVFPDWDYIKSESFCVKAGDSVDHAVLFEKLISLGYEVSEDLHVSKGEYHCIGDVLYIFPFNFNKPVVFDIGFSEIGDISYYDFLGKKRCSPLKKVDFLPIGSPENNSSIFDYFNKGSLLIEDEPEVPDEEADSYHEALNNVDPQVKRINFTSFMEESPYHHHLHYLSVLKYQNILDFIADIKEKISTDWKIVLFTKNIAEYEGVFQDKHVKYEVLKSGLDLARYRVNFVEIDKGDAFPPSFQNPGLKAFIVTDREVIDLKETAKAEDARHRVFSDFLTGLKVNDYVVHSDHGIGVFMGLDKKTVDEVTREYLKIGYAENDKLFVPIDQADKVSKFIGAGDQPPKLTRLGSAEWETITNKVRKETEKIAAELLLLYAKREQAQGVSFENDNDNQIKFEKTFPYTETPGQDRAIKDVKADMERRKPMDRLVCGDVGFGKTEVAMRAAFKAVQGGRQVALVAPITILADQHYKSFKKRMEDFHIRIEMMSRFKTVSEQKKILKKLERGEVDIVIGTHRLLQPDIKFKNLGLVIIDEEQRFGVQQKEKLKDMRAEVDVLTLTATPIPRTLNLSLNNLRDITTITTPPPGRLPIITEVRKFSYTLIREAILRETKDGGQVYFLHNRVQTIEDVASKLRALVPEVRFIVTHGKLSSTELEERIMGFKKAKYDVLISSTIIENGIDLPNANTLIVNDADRFGLAQLYQLRGRVGRGRKQAYAFFLYNKERLQLDAKKRLRAIVEASELGSGFQIAMKDLEIRGAGDILGASQSGAINVVGVSHFIRMLNQAVEELKSGGSIKKGELPQEVTIELPMPALIPDDYIVNFKDKINVYQKLASADSYKYLSELRAEVATDYGKMPTEVSNLFRILELKLLAKKAGVTNVRAENVHSDKDRQVILTMSERVKPENIMNVLEYNAKWIISGNKLKCRFTDLGGHWVDELGEGLRNLAGKIVG
ncbi:MAG: transcription-repair coupling factor [Patescibacteria group bacterium]|nr:transcription-repair coupling factor [Patescibacteria group bacterium]